MRRELGLRRSLAWFWLIVGATWLVALTTIASGQTSGSTVSRSPHGNLSVPCQNCHTSVGWKPIRAVPEFDHDQTRYPLRGLHQGVSCTQCHAKPVFSNTGTNCADCHADIHRRQMGANCQQCHTVKGWNLVVQRLREHENRFPLVGGHAGLDCADCHKGGAVGQFQGLSIQCYSCHQKTFQQTNAPNHVTSGFSTQCEQCHTINTWLNATFDHLKVTGFALTGMHATLDCTACHAGGKYKGTAATCIGCHLSDYQKASSPNHVALGLPQNCQQCHTTAAWQPASFNHDSVGFPLTGGHAKLQCEQCHAGGNFNLTSTACVSCHLKDFQGTNNPNHTSAGLPAAVRGLPFHRELDFGDLQSRHHRLAVDRGAHRAPVQPVSRRRKLQHHQHRLRELPPEGFSGQRLIRITSRRIPSAMRCLPQHVGLEPGDFQPQQHKFPSDRRTYQRSLRELSREQQLHLAAHGLLRLPPSRLSGDDNPNHVSAGFPTVAQSAIRRRVG